MEIKHILFIIFILFLFFYSLHFFLSDFYKFNSYYLTVSALVPLKIYEDLLTPENFKKELTKVGGVYGLLNVKDGKQYIGSSLNLYERLTDHLRGVSSNIRLQRSIAKLGLNNFIFVIYYFHKDPFVILTDIETEVINSFPFEELYNFKKEAKSMLGYKHTAEAITKMKQRLANKNNHPMYGKTHTLEALKAISKPGKLNPMYNKLHNSETRQKISTALSKTPLGLYNTDNKLVKIFINQVKLATEFGVFKSTISRYVKSGKLFQGKYYIRKLNKNR